MVALSLVTFVVIARVLDPEDFGLVALCSVFVFFFSLLTNQGFADALVQRETVELEHFDTAFWSNLGTALVFAGGGAAGAGWLAQGLGEPRLTGVLPWLLLMVPINALTGVPLALLRREMRFKETSLCTLSGRLLGAVVGIAMAVGGFGVWSLVVQQIAAAVVTAAALAIVTGWRPRLRFSAGRFRELWRFGFHVSASQAVVAAGEHMVNLLVGAFLGTVALGYFTIAWRLVDMTRSLIANAVYHVGFAAFARKQNEVDALRRGFLYATRISCIGGFPIAGGIFVLAPIIVDILIGPKWAPSVPVIQILAVAMVAGFYQMFFSALYRALGKANWVLYFALVTFVVVNAALAAAAPFGLVAVAMVWVCRLIFTISVHVAFVSRLLETTAADLVRPAIAPLTVTVLMVGVVWLVDWVFVGKAVPSAVLAALIAIGVGTYLMMSWLLFPDMMRQAVDLLRGMTRQRP